MKFKFFAIILLLFCTVDAISFASPFNIEGVDNAIIESDVEIQKSEPQQDDLSTVESTKDNSDKDNPQRFKELAEVKLKIINIYSGKQSDLQIKLREKTTFNDMSLQLEKCYKTVDDRYNKISIAYVIVTNNDFTKHSVTLSNDLELSTIIASQYIVKAECM